MKPIVLIAGAGLILLAGLAMGWAVKPMPKPTYRDVIVSDTVIMAQQPDTVLKFVDRIKWRTVEPTVIARGDTRDTTRLDAFCRSQPLITESVNKDSALTLTNAVLPPSSGKYDGKTLSLFSVTSDSRLFAQETAVTTPFEWVAVGGTYDVRTTRSGFKLFKALPKFLVPALAGVAVGVVISK